jgi:DNA (cytosine-5)-methyltransferase 1
VKMRRKAPRPPLIRAVLGEEYIVADNFAGGGGASTGLRDAIGRDVDAAVNHDPIALAFHAANHPGTKHYCESVYKVDPRKVCGGKRCALAWFSPDCTHHSSAKGGKPVEQKIRGLAWIAVSWAARVKPDVICLENVPEFEKWGPIHQQHSEGCTGGNGLPDKRGRRGCRKGCQWHRPIASRVGETFRAFVARLDGHGYAVDWRVLRACDYGAPTKRRRLFLVARRDGRPIVWPEATHGPGRAEPHVAVSGCIDWTIPVPSIFGRKKPLSTKTEQRIHHGIHKFVLGARRPFLVTLNHGGTTKSGAPRRDMRVHSVDEPIRTVTGGQRGGHALVMPMLVPYHSDWRTNGGTPVDRPIDTITQRDHHRAVAVSLIRFQGTTPSHIAASGHSAEDPAPSITAQGEKLAAVYAFLVRYNRGGGPEDVGLPIGGLTTKPRFGLVTVTIDGEEFAIVDIGMRMLTPRELFLAQGFPPDYVIAEAGGKRVTKTKQIRLCGNSVPPVMAKVIARAQLEATEELRRAA